MTAVDQTVIEQGGVIGWGFIIAATIIAWIQLKSWVIYRNHVDDIKAKHQALLATTDPLKKAALLKQFALEPSPVGGRVNMVNSAVLSKRSVGIQELSLLTEDEDSRHLYIIIPNTSISTFLVAGLAGTIFLLQRLLSSVFDKDIINTNGLLDTAKMAEVINTLYPGFSHVFQATLYGILCTLAILFIRNVLVHPKRSEFLQELDKLTIEFLLPTEDKLAEVLAPFIGNMEKLAASIKEASLHSAYAIDKSSKANADAMDRASRVNAEAIETLAKLNIENMSKLAIVIKEASFNSAHAIDKSSKANADAINRASRANAEAIETSAKLNMEIAIVNLNNAKMALDAVNTLHEFAGVMKESAAQMGHAVYTLAFTNATLSATFAPDGHWAKLNHALIGTETELKESLEKANLNLGKLSTYVAGLYGSAEILAAVDYEGLQKQLAGLSDDIKASTSISAELMKTHEGLLSGFVRDPNSLNNTFMALNTTIRDIGPRYIEEQSSLNETMRDFGASTIKIEENLPALQSGLHKASTHILQLCASITDLNKANFQGLHDGIHGLDTSLRTASEAYSSLAQIQRSVGNQISDTQTALRLSFESLESSIAVLKKEIATSVAEIADTSVTLKSVNTNTAAIARIDFSGLQQKLATLQAVMDGPPWLKGFSSFRQEIEGLAGLLQTWTKVQAEEKTSDRLEEILTNLQRFESESSRVWKNIKRQ